MTAQSRHSLQIIFRRHRLSCLKGASHVETWREHHVFGHQLNNARARFLIPLIEGWGEAIDRFATWFKDDDVPYWYNERANISMLNAGAWLAGYVGIEEFAITKGWGEQKGNGRADLLVALAPLIKGDMTVSFEAKLEWMQANM